MQKEKKKKRREDDNKQKLFSPFFQNLSTYVNNLLSGVWSNPCLRSSEPPPSPPQTTLLLRTMGRGEQLPARRNRCHASITAPCFASLKTLPPLMLFKSWRYPFPSCVRLCALWWSLTRYLISSYCPIFLDRGRNGKSRPKPDKLKLV